MSDRPSPMSEDVALAALHAQLFAAVHNLWAIYVVATFAAAGFGSTRDDLSPAVAAAVTIGFLAFALGHFYLLRQTLRILGGVRADIAAPQPEQKAISVAEPAPKRLVHTWQKIIPIDNKPAYAGVFHVVIDACVVVAIWLPILLRGK